jgi:hypothetical protein
MQYAFVFVYIVTHEGFAWLIIMGSGLDDWIYWHLYYNYNQLYQLIISDSLRLAPFLAGLRVFSLPLWQMPNEESLLTESWNSLTSESNNLWAWVWVLCYDRWSVCLGITHLGLTTRFLLQSDSCGFVDVGGLSLTRRRVCRLQLLLAFASAVVLGSESRETRDHILLSQIRDFLFVASYDSQGYGGGIRARLHTGFCLTSELSFITSGEPNRDHHLEYLDVILPMLRECVFREPLTSKWTFASVHCYSCFQAMFTEPLPSKWSYSSQ